jgi:hypothetical protein
MVEQKIRNYERILFASFFVAPIVIVCDTEHVSFAFHHRTDLQAIVVQLQIPLFQNIAGNTGHIDTVLSTKKFRFNPHGTATSKMAESNTRSSLSPASSNATPRPNRTASVGDKTAGTPNSPRVARDKKTPRTSEDFENSFQMNLAEEMEEEKLRYPGASSWAPDEERLFEILYLRQDLPMLPLTWDYDLSGVPISDVIFQTSEQFPPIIYAHDKDFRGKFPIPPRYCNNPSG